MKRSLVHCWPPIMHHTPTHPFTHPFIHLLLPSLRTCQCISVNCPASESASSVLGSVVANIRLAAFRVQGHASAFSLVFPLTYALFQHFQALRSYFTIMHQDDTMMQPPSVGGWPPADTKGWPLHLGLTSTTTLALHWMVCRINISWCSFLFNFFNFILWSMNNSTSISCEEEEGK